MRRGYLNIIKRSKISVCIMSILIIFSIVSETSLATLFAATPYDQDTPAVQADGLEYQTISSIPGKDKSEVVTLDGLMPVNAEVNVKPSQEYKGDSLFAYNISITDQNGDEFQPESGEPIKVEITNSAIGEAKQANQKLRLWHIDDNGLREEITDFTVKDDKIIFEASGFSIYEVDDGKPALRTYKFMMPGNPHDNNNYAAYYYPINSQREDGSYKEICSQTIKNGESLIFPQLPADMDSKYTFVGWFIGHNDTPSDQQLDFNNVPPVTQTETVELYAVFESCVYAIFHEQYNGRTKTFPVFATRRGRLVRNEQTSKLEAEFNFDDLKVIYDDDEKEEGAPPSMQFVGWTTQQITDYTSGETAEKLPSPYTFSVSEDSPDKSIRLYPIFEPIRWLEFDSNGTGATYIPPKSFPKDEGIVFNNPVPVRSGYTFKGWYTDENSGVQVTDGSQNIISGINTEKLVSRDGKLFVKEPNIQVKLYAHWEPGASKYTVIVWKQKVTDAPDLSDSEKSYDFSESFTVSAATGSTASVANQYKQFAIKNSANYKSEYQGFSYGRCSADDTVTGDGKTVLDVYYDRNVHTFTFKSNTAVIHSVRGIYGSDISGIWHFTGSNGINYPTSTTSWKPTGSDTYTARITQMLLMPDEDITFTHTSTSNTKRYFHYYVEAFPGDENTRTYSGREFVPYNDNMETVENDFNYIYYEDDFFQLEGFERLAAATASGNTVTIGSNTPWNTSWNNNLYFYYLRKSYTIEYVDTFNNNVIIDKRVKYQESLEDTVPDVPQAPEGYHFTGWYADESCTTTVFFHEPTQAEIESVTDDDGDAHYQVYDRMHANALRIYAGWETIWYKIEIDPNGGELSTSQSTFFWEPYNGDPIVEYINASRNFEADVNGSFYYVKHDRAYYGLGDTWEEREDSIRDRSAYYTTDMSQATDATRYREATGAYRYLGWFEVDPDTGDETPYYFGKPVMHDTYLRLHWKQLGTFYIRYDAGEGSIDTEDQNEKTFEFLDSDDYADHADVVVTRVAKPVNGKNFVGWRIKNDPSETVYYPGQSFQFSSAYAEPVSEIDEDTGEVKVKRTIIMEAVYEEIKTAKIIYDANGGTITDPDNAILPANAGWQVINGAPSPVDDPDYYTGLSVEYSVNETQLTVSDLLNNSAVKLSNGTGFYNHGYTFLGWSTSRDGSDAFYGKESITMTNRWVDANEPSILYAQWEVRVYFDRNDVTPGNTYYWGSGTGNDWSADRRYFYDSDKGMYYTLIKLNGKTEHPPHIPSSSDPEEVFSHWSTEKQTVAGVDKPVFDFSTTAITQEMIDLQHNDGNYLVLHSCWKAPIRIPVYYVDTSDKEWVRRDNWRKSGDGSNIVLRDDRHILLVDKADADKYAKDDMTTGYVYAFATAVGNGNEDYKNITDTAQITEIWYDMDEVCVKAKYSDNSEREFDAENQAVYLVYYKSPETVDINYDLMAVNGSLTSVSVNSSAPRTTTISSGSPYNMTGNITQPIEWSKWGNGSAQKYQYYSFAVGKSDAAGASDLRFITGYKTSDSDRPDLQVRLSWNGFEYSTDGVTWTNCGYDVVMYSVYYEQLPTIVNLREETIALPDKMGTEFNYTITVNQTETKTVTRTYYYHRQNGNYYHAFGNNSQYPPVQTPSSETTNVNTIATQLSDGQSDSYVVFYSSPADTDTGYIPYYVNGQPQTYISGHTTYDVFYRDVTSDQSISQTIDITQAQDNFFSTTNNAAVSGDTNVFNSKYTSTATGDPVTITYTNRQNLEKAVNVAVSSGDELTARNGMRTTNTSIYKHDFTNSGVWNVSDSEVVSPSGLIDGRSDYIFLGIITGKEQNARITRDQTNITDISFGEISPGVYGYYLNGDTTNLLNDKDVWFVYAKKPTIRYLYEKPNGTFVEITSFTRNNAPFTRPEIAQGETLPVTADGLLINQISTPGSPAFLIPGDLDYQGDALRIDLNRVSVGNSTGITEESASESMQITLTDEKLQYRFHENDTPQTFAEDSIVYAVYKIKGYELTLSKQAIGDTAGRTTFTFEISSDQLIYGSYDTSKGQVTVSENKITLSVQRNQNVTIYGLLSGEYTIKETTSGSYEMTAKVNGTDARVTNNMVAASITENTRVDVLNKYPIPVTEAGGNTVHSAIVVMLLMAAVIVFILWRRGEKQNERFLL